MKRLVCIVEGSGEVAAIPNLCARILRHLGVAPSDWMVDQDPIRKPRGSLVDERERSPRRPCRKAEIERAVALARKRRADAVLVLCDEDDDCAAIWGPDARQVIRRQLAGEAVMAVREYETWLLLSRSEEALAEAGIAAPERLRDAKKALARLVPGYKPAAHQLGETRRIDLQHLRLRSPSFDKLVRSLASLCDVGMPRPEG